MKIVASLILGMRWHDFRAVRTFFSLYPATLSFPVKCWKFMDWTAGQVLFVIPDAMRTMTASGSVSRTPYWLGGGNPLAGHPWNTQADAELPSDCRVVVIGAGFTGAALAYHWSKLSGSEHGRLVVVEMDDPASGASGRNGGEVVMGRYFAMVYRKMRLFFARTRPELSPELVDESARQFADVYSRAAYANAEGVARTIEEEAFDCDYRRNGWVCAKDADEQQELDEAVNLGAEAGWDDWKRVSAEDASRRSEARVSLPAAFSQGAASFHPAKWVWSLLNRALERGPVDLFTRTRVSEVKRHGSGYRVDTDRGMIQTRHVVYATESYTANLLKSFKGVLQARQTQGAYAAPLDTPINADRATLSTSTGYVIAHDGGLVFGSDETPVADRNAGCNRPSRFITCYLLGEIRRCFGPLRLKISHEWSATAGFTPDEYPIVGSIDGHGQHIIAGMCGSGTAVSFNAARCIVNRLLGLESETDDYPEAYFAPSRVLDPKNHPWPECPQGGVA